MASKGYDFLDGICGGFLHFLHKPQGLDTGDPSRIITGILVYIAVSNVG
jgi:hypothetical protein